MEKELLIRIGAIEAKLKALRLALTDSQQLVYHQYLDKAKQRFAELHEIHDKALLQLLDELFL